MRIIIAAGTLVLAGCSGSASHNNMATHNGSANANGLASASAPANAAASNAAAPVAPAVAAYTAGLSARWPAGTAITPAEVGAMVTARGARTAVQTLAEPADGANRWTSVIRGIAMGEQAWLDLVPQLRGGTDAGTTDDIVLALLDAVISNPTGALRLFALDPNDARNFCVENGFETSPVQARAFYAAAIAAVENVTAADLEMIKTVCLTSLREGAARPVPAAG